MIINNEYKYKRERIYCPNSVRLVHTTMELIVFSKDFIMFINSVAVVIRRLVYLPIISIRNQKVNFAHNLIYQKNFSIFLSKSLTENSCSTTRPRIMILTLC